LAAIIISGRLVKKVEVGIPITNRTMHPRKIYLWIIIGIPSGLRSELETVSNDMLYLIVVKDLAFFVQK
jgi:hypothetical protein